MCGDMYLGGGVDFYFGCGELGASQDKIGWKRFMEGMVSKEFEQEHEATYQAGRSRLSGKAWVRHLVQRLLEFTHGIWIYRIVMHSCTTISLGF